MTDSAKPDMIGNTRRREKKHLENKTELFA